LGTAFSLPGQLRGPECRRVAAQGVKLRKVLAPWVSTLRSDLFNEIAVVLRVGGSLGSFEPAGVENVGLSGTVLSCDLAIPDKDWANVSDEAISAILRDQVCLAIHKCLDEYEISHDYEELRRSCGIAT
jgi:hypothetical protein